MHNWKSFMGIPVLHTCEFEWLDLTKIGDPIEWSKVSSVIPAKAGIRAPLISGCPWTKTFQGRRIESGMTVMGFHVSPT
jgi:hypothetical protein